MTNGPNKLLYLLHCIISAVGFNILSYVRIFLISLEAYQACVFCSELRAKLGLKPLERDDDDSKAGI